MRDKNKKTKKPKQGHVRQTSKMESLSDELITDILSRVPTFELRNLRCVCKKWKDIVRVKDPLFRTLHSSHSMSRPTESNLLLLKGLDDDLCFLDVAASRGGEVVSFKTIKTPYVDVPSFPQHAIIGSCNGLLCLGSKVLREILVMNPFTNQHMRLDMNFPGDCSKWGFGFESVKKRYKVFVVVWNSFYAKRELKICDLDSECSSNWRDIGPGNMFNNKVSVIKPPCFVNGRLHWIRYDDDCTWTIISFDLADEETRLILTPPNCLPIARTFDLFVLRDCLCIIRSGISLTPTFEIWVMTEYGVKESWVKEVDTVAVIPKSLISHVDKMQKRKWFRLALGGLGSMRDGKVLLKYRRTTSEEAILFSTDPTCDHFQFLEYGSAPFFKESIIHTASLNWI